jgi:hypothetical protein
LLLIVLEHPEPQFDLSDPLVRLHQLLLFFLFDPSDLFDPLVLLSLLDLFFLFDLSDQLSLLSLFDL